MASAKRLIEVRQRWRSSSRVAEISVPAWPIPIHQTKLTVGKPHPIRRWAHPPADRLVHTPDSDARHEKLADREQQDHEEAERDAQCQEPAEGCLLRQN